MLHRRSFLAGLGGAVAAAPAAAAFTGPSRFPLGPSYIVNMAEQGVVDDLAWAEGQDLDLVRDPQRAFDPKSIAVVLGSRRLGYLPANQSKLLAPIVDGGLKIEATLVSVTAHPRPLARINLFLAPS